MTVEPQKPTPMFQWKKGTSMVILIVLVLGTIVWRASRSSSVTDAEPILPSAHPLFGPIYETTGVYGDPVRVPNASSFRPMSSMTIGPGLMDWIREELKGKSAGCLSMWDPFMKTSNVWSFAACSNSNLAQVTKADLEARFCSALEDEKGRTVFGKKWGRSENERVPHSAAICVAEGDVILAKHISRPDAIYVLEMTKQYRGSMRVRYVEVLE